MEHRPGTIQGPDSDLPCLLHRKHCCLTASSTLVEKGKKKGELV